MTVTDLDSSIASATVILTPYYENLDNMGYATSVEGISYSVTKIASPAGYMYKFTADSGVATPAQFQKALRGITYSNDGPYNQNADRVFTYVVTDENGGINSVENSTRRLTIVPTNDPPELPKTAKAISTNEVGRCRLTL